jgi:hypothetical protein
MKLQFPVAVILILVCFSCKLIPEEKDKFNPTFSTYKPDPVKTVTPIKKNEIFYGTLTPVEICSIFNRLGVKYNSTVTNPVSNSGKYLSSSKTALNTGIYGVDFGYLKMFGIGQDMINYVVTIRNMSGKLGIPDTYITSPLKVLQGDPDPDSVMFFMNEAYNRMENHLRESGRESTAGLMVIGGWVEAMYIATQFVYDPQNPDPEVIQRIAEQKYTLNSLLSFVKNYYDDPVVVYYSKKLKYLNNYFDSFNIYFKKGDLEIDTARQVFRASGSEMDVTVDILNKIRDYISALRAEIIST